MTPSDLRPRLTHLIDRWTSLNVHTRNEMADEIIALIKPYLTKADISEEYTPNKWAPWEKQ